MIDLRSDTVTKPTQEMLNAMFSAQVGDDVFGEDPSVNELQSYAANLFGMEDALFCPSGTMTNQIAIKVHTQAQEQVICHQNAHVYLYEAGGIAFNSFCSVKLLDNPNGILTPQSIKDAVTPDDVHFPKTSLVCLENTFNRAGGKCYELTEMQDIYKTCKDLDLKLHLDGARIFNAIIAKGYTPQEVGNCFDSISVCLSKGLGSPVGSLLIGTQKDIRAAKRIRKVWGGGMRQAGYLAAAALFALKNNVERLADDHKRAKEIEKVLLTLPYIKSVLPVETNILVFEPNQDLYTPDQLIEIFKSKGILTVRFGATGIRMVTHLQFTDQDLYTLIDILKSL